jgi:hypothetical protein
MAQVVGYLILASVAALVLIVQPARILWRAYRRARVRRALAAIIRSPSGYHDPAVVVRRHDGPPRQPDRIALRCSCGWTSAGWAVGCKRDSAPEASTAAHPAGQPRSLRWRKG